MLFLGPTGLTDCSTENPAASAKAFPRMGSGGTAMSQGDKKSSRLLSVFSCQAPGPEAIDLLEYASETQVYWTTKKTHGIPSSQDGVG